MWARNGIVSHDCPKSVITAQSLYFLEQFRYWKQLGGMNANAIEAKTAEAIAVLEEAWRVENQRGEVQKEFTVARK